MQEMSDQSDAGLESQPRLIPLKLGKQILGRGKDCDIQLRDQTVSRHHAAIVRTKLAITLIDLDSQNGTRVNGELVTEVILQPSDVIHFGAESFRVSSDPPMLIDNAKPEESSTKSYDPSSGNCVSPTLALTPACEKVLEQLLAGYSEKEIACKKKVSVHTVHKQVQAIYRQFNVNSRAELLAKFVNRASKENRDQS